MKNDIIKYLNSVDSRTKDYVIMWKFYLYTDDCIINNTKELINNIHFINLLLLCLKDKEFIDRIKNNLIFFEKINFILLESIELTNDDDYKKVLKIIESCIVQRKISREEVVRKLIEEYPSENDYLLEKYNYDSEIIIKYLMCDNEFLDILNSVLIEKNLGYNSIVNIVKILDTGIKIYNIIDFINLNQSNDLSWAITNIGVFKIKRFNIEKAKSLKIMFEKKVLESNVKKLK